MDLGGLWWTVEEDGEVCGNVVERVGQMWTMHEIMEALGEQIFPLYICRYIYCLFFSYGCCLLENGIHPSESIRGKTFNEPITTVQL